MRAPILVAAGVFGYGAEHAEVLDLGRLGAFCTRSTTLRARSGNPPPRMAETASGLLNSVGLHNPGVDAVIERHAARWARLDVPVIVSIAGESVDDILALVRKLDGESAVAGLELNLSCPNAARGGTLFGLDADAAGQLTAAVRRATDLPILVKLSPAAADVRTVARAVEAGGADAISAVNTLPGLAIDREGRRATLGTAYGGLSGPAIKPVALRVVWEVAQVVTVPIVGIGGVADVGDVVEFLLAGATAVAVGTAVLADPMLPIRLVDELAAYCADRGLASPRELVGKALPSRRDRPSSKGAEYRP
jgi:dihydroorotate dehydrogenase (NAD+) catalytic subunit